MLENYLPTIIAFIVGLITAYVNLRIGKLKTNVDTKALTNSASDALRDDLLDLVGRYESREKMLVEKSDKVAQQNEQLQTTINTLRLEVNALRIENATLQSEVHKLRTELAAFERKVYYIPPQNKENT